MSAESATQYRADAARINFLSAARPDLQHAVAFVRRS